MFAAVLLIDLGGILANTGWVARGVLVLLLPETTQRELETISVEDA